MDLFSHNIYLQLCFTFQTIKASIILDIFLKRFFHVVTARYDDDGTFFFL